MHLMQALGIQREPSTIAITYPPITGKVTDIDGQGQTVYRRRVFWVGNAIHTIFSYEYSRPRVVLEDVNYEPVDSVVSPNTKHLLYLAEVIPKNTRTVTRQGGCAVMDCAGLVERWQGGKLSGHMSNQNGLAEKGGCETVYSAGRVPFFTDRVSSNKWFFDAVYLFLSVLSVLFHLLDATAVLGAPCPSRCLSGWCWWWCCLASVNQKGVLDFRPFNVSKSKSAEPTTSNILSIRSAALQSIQEHLTNRPSSSHYSVIPWWSLISIPFHFILILLSIDTPECLAQVSHLLAIIRAVGAAFDTHLTRGALQNA
ncbi:uncharacterized protein A1O5_04352 [Cladophialophora psammophila CBS 110553]|uniref:Uncharacterized protein n=1 Tax=Cladophialophora psammophila CBS 110553 TaxID=1182543 RepID=W9X4M5_9EURO|nr:uncharacterized protein A1O5_04352 [Cladophialophora psammophila CBS 110553]EXJ71851.1 hypothetical protein A1O5_04352 [Cladophialophora psammophila CBS 110553]